ncbi:MAG: hypothetical protein KY432_06985 [Acidobacteria bacterium]|nr:hypothetical protein [Acidobacteriota bacterium]
MLKRLAIAIVSLSFVFAADAKTWRTENFDFDSTGVSMVEIEHPVGELEIAAGPSERIEVQMRVECSSRRNRCGERIEDIELVSGGSGSTLTLRVEGFPKTTNSLTVDLQVTMPARMSLDIDRGVGETTVRNIAGDISVEAGVGEVRITAPVSSIGEVRAECGVGEVDLDVPDGRIEKDGFLFLGNELTWQGEGASFIDVEIGVGSVNIDLE